MKNSIISENDHAYYNRMHKMGIWITVVTGNILNLKLPASLNALKVANVKAGTPQADAITGLAVAVSSIVTLVLLAIGALLLTPLQPLFSSPAVTVAAGNILPALFGCLAIGAFSKDLGGVTAKGRMYAILPAFAVCIIAYLLVPDLYNLAQGVAMIICIALIYLLTKLLYKKGVIKVFLPGEQTAETENTQK